MAIGASVHAGLFCSRHHQWHERGQRPTTVGWRPSHVMREARDVSALEPTAATFGRHPNRVHAPGA